MSHDEVKEVLGLYVLGALDGAEARAVEQHLAGCTAECPFEQAETRDAAGMLAFAARAVEPSRAARERLLASLPAPDSRRAEIRSQPRRRRSGLFLGGVAAFAIAASAAFFIVDLVARLESAESELARLRDRAIFLGAADTTTVALAGTDEAPAARAKLSYDRRTGRALLIGYDLPEAPRGKAYQLWFIAGNKPLPGRVFVPGVDGGGEWNDTVPPEGRAAELFAVTLEPSGGVESPTGPMMLKSS